MLSSESNEYPHIANRNANMGKCGESSDESKTHLDQYDLPPSLMYKKWLALWTLVGYVRCYGIQNRKALW